MASLRQSHPAMRALFIGAGVLMFAAGAAIAPLPGPGGIFFFAAGLALILPNSRWAMRRFAQLKRRWPRTGQLVDRAMRRPSARRRHARAQALARAARVD